MLRKRRNNQSLAHANPVAAAIARQKMNSHMVTFNVGIFMKDDGEPAADLLADLGWLLAIGAELSAQLTPGTTDARRIHAALRTVIQLSVEGGNWQSSQAGVLKLAADSAKKLIVDNPTKGLSLIDEADYIASRILAGTATLADVAGPEIYAAAAALKG
jgi:hypothetical protein